MIWGTLLHECCGFLGLVLSIQGLVFRVARVLRAPRSAQQSGQRNLLWHGPWQTHNMCSPLCCLLCSTSPFIAYSQGHFQVSNYQAAYEACVGVRQGYSPVTRTSPSGTFFPKPVNLNPEPQSLKPFHTPKLPWPLCHPDATLHHHQLLNSKLFASGLESSNFLHHKP